VDSQQLAFCSEGWELYCSHRPLTHPTNLVTCYALRVTALVPFHGAGNHHLEVRSWNLEFGVASLLVYQSNQSNQSLQPPSIAPSFYHHSVTT
ncbi:MAG: hypothetical protein PWP06_1297, partial [Candidatus Marinimicrobia bacterium]|nr:hypothetical protein [Candidatus Neomarinimicrobiota bacterium]